MPPILEVAIERKIISSEKKMRTYELLAAMAKFNTIFHSGKISSIKWQAQKTVLEEVIDYLNTTCRADLLAGETYNSSIHEINDELLEAYLGITTKAYSVSQDLLERFFCRIAPTKKKRTRQATHILQLISRLIKSQTEFWGSGQSTTDNYHLIEMMDCTMEHQAEEEFL